LNIPDNELTKNSEYKKAYSEQAHKIKKKKVWTNFGIGSGAWVLLLLLL
jgi:HKD family nuclease